MAGIQFFEMSFADIIRSLVTTTITHNSGDKDYLVNRDRFFDWISIGAASDATTVTYEVDFGVARTVDTLFLKDTNLKEFELQYWNGAAWVSVFTETANTETFYSKIFTAFTAELVRFLMKKTNPANAEKELGEFIITRQIGQFVGYPEVDFTPDRNVTEKKMLTGGSKFTYNGSSVAIKIDFKNYVGNADRDLFTTLYNRYEACLVWLCGGDESQFLHADEGYRLEDLYLMAVSKPYSHSFTKNLYRSGFTASLSFQEVA